MANVVEMLDDLGGWKAAATAVWREQLHAATAVGRMAGARVAVELGYAPVVDVTGELSFGPDVLVIPEFAFGAGCPSYDIHLCPEHVEYRWFTYEEARRELRWDSNRNALWELDLRLRRIQAS